VSSDLHGWRLALFYYFLGLQPTVHLHASGAFSDT